MRHYRNGVISQLKIKEDEFVTTEKQMLNHSQNFYEKLYKCGIEEYDLDDLFGNFVEDLNINISSEDERENCKGLFRKGELLQAPKTMEFSKSPGSDGIPAEFYKVFWHDISDRLLDSINYSYEQGQFSITQRRGIIKLIPKKDADPSLIRNWHPIMLLNCDYKIVAKALANRVQKFLPKMLNSDQTGFMKGRFIGDNIRLIDGIIDSTSEENLVGLLLFLDFEKAFDTMEWNFIKKRL